MKVFRVGVVVFLGVVLFFAGILKQFNKESIFNYFSKRIKMLEDIKSHEEIMRLAKDEK